MCILFFHIITGLGAPETLHGNLASAPSTNVRFNGVEMNIGGDSVNKMKHSFLKFNNSPNSLRNYVQDYILLFH